MPVKCVSRDCAAIKKGQTPWHVAISPRSFCALLKAVHCRAPINLFQSVHLAYMLSLKLCVNHGSALIGATFSNKKRRLKMHALEPTSAVGRPRS
eukprot:5008474-Amphidinium_carterae.1